MKLTIELNCNDGADEVERILVDLVSRLNPSIEGPYNLHNRDGVWVDEARLSDDEGRDDEGDYAALIERVRAIDPDAARYMETEARTLESFAPGNGLWGVFYWDATPQGHDYWSGLARRLGES